MGCSANEQGIVLAEAVRYVDLVKDKFEQKNTIAYDYHMDTFLNRNNWKELFTFVKIEKNRS